MDVVIPLLFMAVFYLGPALLKKYRAKQNPQPAAPEVVNFEMMNAPLTSKETATSMGKSGTQFHSQMAVDKQESVSTIALEQSAWHGKLDSHMIANGVIFAEILQPPRAYRPFGKR